MVPVPDRPGDRADELEGGTGAAAGRGQPEGVGWQPDDGVSAGAGRGDVGVGNRPPTTAGTGGLHHRRLAGIRQPTPPQTRAANGAVNKYKNGTLVIRAVSGPTISAQRCSLLKPVSFESSTKTFRLFFLRLSTNSLPMKIRLVDGMVPADAAATMTGAPPGWDDI